MSLAPTTNNKPESYEVIYEVIFKTMYFNQDTETILTVWNAQSEFISDEDYKADSEATILLIRDSEARYMISDHRENKFTISDDLQKWYGELIARVLGGSCFEKCAVIITTDLHLLSALEEIKTNIENVEEEHTIQTRFFNDFTEAKKWLLGK